MAQYDSELPGEDFFDIDDPIDNINYSNLNNEDPDETDDTAPVGVMIPLLKTESSKKDKKKTSDKSKKSPVETQRGREDQDSKSDDVRDDSPLDDKQIPAILLEICEEYGLLASKQMESALKRSQKHGTVTKEAIKWFVQGYLVCMTSHIMTNVNENMNDMRKEIKIMQMNTASMGAKADVIVRAAGGLDDKIKEATESVKERFQETLENVEKFVSDRVSALSNIVESTIEETILNNAAKDKLLVKPVIEAEDRQIRSVPKQVIAIPDEIKLHPDIGKSAEASAASAEEPVAARKSILSTVGFTPIFIKQLSADVILEIIPPNLFAEIKSMTMTSRIKSAVKSAVLENLTAAAKGK